VEKLRDDGRLEHGKNVFDMCNPREALVIKSRLQNGASPGHFKPDKSAPDENPWRENNGRHGRFSRAKF
jgi:hypothetical protein